jgi:hypothetical protein
MDFTENMILSLVVRMFLAAQPYDHNILDEYAMVYSRPSESRQEQIIVI